MSPKGWGWVLVSWPPCVSGSYQELGECVALQPPTLVSRGLMQAVNFQNKLKIISQVFGNLFLIKFGFLLTLEFPIPLQAI